MSKRGTRGQSDPGACRPKGEQALDLQTYQQIRQAVRELQR